jgi:uncharacterized membrane protein
VDAQIIGWVRLVHVVLAAFWVGGDVFFFLLIGPVLKAMGPAAEAFSLTLLRRGGFGRILFPIAITTVAAGGFLYYSLGYYADPFADASRATLTVGAVIAVAVLLGGLLFFLPRERRLVRIAKAIGPEGPSPEQSQDMQRIGAAMDRPSKVSVAMLALAFLLMVGHTLV